MLEGPKRLYYWAQIHQNERNIQNYIFSQNKFGVFRSLFHEEGEQLALTVLTSFGMKPGKDGLRNDYLRRKVNKGLISVVPLTIPLNYGITSTLQVPIYAFKGEPFFNPKPLPKNKSLIYSDKNRIPYYPQNFKYSANYENLLLRPSEFAARVVQFANRVAHPDKIEDEAVERELKDDFVALYAHLFYAMVESVFISEKYNQTPIVHLSRDGQTNYVTTRPYA